MEIGGVQISCFISNSVAKFSQPENWPRNMQLSRIFGISRISVDEMKAHTKSFKHVFTGRFGGPGFGGHAT